MAKLQVGVVASIMVLCLLRKTSAFTYTFPDCTVAPLKGNAVCDTSKDATTRARAIIEQFTVDELMANTVNLSPGVPRLGLPSYQWWSEALHGVAGSPGVFFAPSGNFSFATSFPQPIVMSAAFNDELIKEVATVISTEARAFNNGGRAGIDYFTPNINPFKDPRWGRGQETPGEDPFRIQQYVFNLVQGLQGGLDPKPYYKIIADCKHFAAYDLENWNGNNRMSFDAVVTPQDLSEYYLPPFQSCVRDAKVASVMCSYNSVNGVPSCANSYLLQSILRDHWGFNDDGRWVTSDCDAVDNIFSTHKFTADYPHAVADALKAGTDVDCGTAYSLHLPDAFNQSLITRDDLEKALVRQYSSLVRLGYFDSPQVQPYRQLSWADVNTPNAQALALQAAVEGIVLLKNDGTLPFKNSIKKIAFIGPYANATTSLQGNYQGTAPFLVSPVQGAINEGFSATYTPGTTISGNSTTGFAAAIAAANAADAVVFAGGIDESVEREGLDRMSITWPGNQLDLVSQLAALGKPLVVMQFGGGQVDGSALKSNPKVNSILWAGYPGQSGGTALGQIISGKAAPAGRLVTTQYPAEFVNQVGMTDMNIRPSTSNPGRTYKWYTGTPVFQFGHGLHFTSFDLSWQHQPKAKYQIPRGLGNAPGSTTDLKEFDTFTVNVKNTGKTTSDYVALLFLSGTGGPAPLPNKQLVSYTRLSQIKAGGQSTASLKVTLGSVARADAKGNLWLYPGSYQLTVDTGVERSLVHEFELVGDAVQISSFPQNSS
ncbi:putative exo-1,4-beta-xylosidase bxlB [Psilocybe cubensis]|uniref:Exo-1,4-beta-xylosidase bxlB n=2 Tax=Psilocybe cubensis TaxID=181762 RepID=A0ACB8H4V8_PSICU|nr:putative exo-1,4-beta-xylosidase bxlB [Psilocybe cubensis]KAH9482881.1 putative exo-1,4-beta-xylosidase bxlB [Psilocybe cubensis]